MFYLVFLSRIKKVCVCNLFQFIYFRYVSCFSCWTVPRWSTPRCTWRTPRLSGSTRGGPGRRKPFSVGRQGCIFFCNKMWEKNMIKRQWKKVEKGCQKKNKSFNLVKNMHIYTYLCIFFLQITSNSQNWSWKSIAIDAHLLPSPQQNFIGGKNIKRLHGTTATRFKWFNAKGGRWQITKIIKKFALCITINVH